MFNSCPDYYCNVQDVKIISDPLHRYEKSYDALSVICHKDPKNLKVCSYCKEPKKVDK